MAYLHNPYLFRDDKSRILLKDAMEPYVEEVQEACWGWCS